jgi:hypothetical protein
MYLRRGEGALAAVPTGMEVADHCSATGPAAPGPPRWPRTSRTDGSGPRAEAASHGRLPHGRRGPRAVGADRRAIGDRPRGRTGGLTHAHLVAPGGLAGDRSGARRLGLPTPRADRPRRAPAPGVRAATAHGPAARAPAPRRDATRAARRTRRPTADRAAGADRRPRARAQRGLAGLSRVRFPLGT